MVMTSSQISGLVGAQQAMFGNFQSYATQITPAYAGAMGGMEGAAQMMGGMRPPTPGYGSPYGIGMGVPPPPPPMPTMGYGPNPAMMQGGMGMAGGIGWLAGTGTQYGGQALGEHLMGSGLNMAGTLGVGASYLNTGAGIAGMLGFGGLGMAAMGGFGAMGAIAAAGYGINQMGVGFRQRQGINRVLRNRFGGMQGVGQGRGGFGFGTEEMGQISQMVREMGTEDIFTNVEELTRVMDRTASMGLYRGVNSARQFRARFKETIDTLRDVAQTMNTSLEDATAFMEQGRSMGFFSGRDINANLMRTRFGAGATGMSVGQVQAMGQAGAQIGRMMGMRGRSGAQAMQNMGINIAQQMQMGLLSDETVAEATGGLTGAEGATAMAQQMLEFNNRWLQQGAGRVMMAGLWDTSSGGINQAMLRRVQSGQVGLRELRTMGRQNIARTGGNRSEFFAQEERLRGQLQESGGGALMFGAIGQHFAQRRGLELEDPIVQRFMRRRFGMTQAQVEAQTQAFRNMPQAMERTRARMAQQMEGAAWGRAREMGGIQGLERRLSQMWERNVENPFRDLADRLTTQVSRGIETLVNDLEGRVKVQMTEQTKTAYEELAMWGSTSRLPGLGGGGGRHGLGSTDLSGLMPGGDSGLGIGGLRGMARGLGNLIGTRGSESLLETAHGMGLGRMVGNKFRLNTGMGEALGGGAAGPYEQFRVSGGPTIFDKQTTYATAGELQEAVRAANEVRMMSAEDLGVDSGSLDRMATAARNAVMERYADPATAREYARKNTRGLNTRSRDALARKRIALIRSKDAEIDRRFAALDGDRNKEIALLREIEAKAGIADTSLAAPAGPAGVGSAYGATMDEIQGWRRESEMGLSTLRTGGTRDVVTGTGGVGDDIFGGGTTTTVANRLNLSPEVVRGLMEIDSVRENFQTWRFGNASEKADALGRLRQLANTPGQELSKSQQQALQQLTSSAVIKQNKEDGRLSHFIGRYFKSVSQEGLVAIVSRERELGRQMGSSLKDQQHVFASAGREDAFNKIKEIARLRRTSKSQKDVARTGEAEREFYAAYANDEEVQRILAETPGMEYLAAGAGATARLAESLTSAGSATGSKRVERLLKTTLSAAGLGDLGIPQDELQRLSEMTRAGETDLVNRQIREYAEKKGGEYVQKLEARAKLLKTSLQVGVGGVQDEEAVEFATRAGIGAAAKLRAEGGNIDKSATSALQEKILMSMKKSVLINMEIARNTGTSAEWLKSVYKGEHYGLGGSGGEE